MVSCVSATPAGIQPTATAGINGYQTSQRMTPSASLPTSTPVLSVTQTTPTTVISVVTRTVIPTHQSPPTATPSPTFTPGEGVELVRELLATNSNCELPCWWGFYPGRVLTLANIDLAMRMPYRLISDSIIGFAIHYPDHDAVAGFDYHVDVDSILIAGTISEIQVSVSTTTLKPSVGIAKDWQAFELQRVLNKFGTPTEVRIHATTVTPERDTPLLYSIDILYAEKGIAIHYIGDLKQHAGQYVICPSLSTVRGISLLLTDSGDIAGFKNSLSRWTFYDNAISSTIQDAVGMSPADLHNLLKKSADACIAMPNK
jgi:hypothetical protein